MSWWVWVLLVVAALVGAAWLARSLWRSGIGLVREAGRAGQTLGSVGERAAQAAAGSVPPDTSPTLFDDPDELRGRVAEVRRRRAERSAARWARQERTARQWSDGAGAVDGWLARRQAQKAAAATASARRVQADGGRARTRLP